MRTDSPGYGKAYKLKLEIWSLDFHATVGINLSLTSLESMHLRLGNIFENFHVETQTLSSFMKVSNQYEHLDP